jgi:hypothetical protein
MTDDDMASLVRLAEQAAGLEVGRDATLVKS